MNAACYQYGIDCPLPTTGFDLVGAAILGLVLLVMGACILWSSRRWYG